MAQNPIKGQLLIQVDQAELEASVNFTPSAQGQDWTPELIQRSLLESGLMSVSPKSVEQAFSKLSAMTGPSRFIIAKGSPPEPPVPETVEWANTPIPPEFKTVAEDLVAKTPLPALYRVRVEKCQKATIVKKPNPIPFMPPKEETVMVVDNREIREAIPIDPQVLGSAWVKEKEKIGTSVPAKPGKAGKSLFGRSIPAAPTENAEFHHADSILRNGREFVAASGGILRYGRNWAEILPFAVHEWSVTATPDKTSFLLDYQPGDPRLAPPNASDILAKAESMGAKRSELMDERDLDLVIREAAAAGEALMSRMLSTDRHAEVSIDISPDLLKASLTLRKGRGRGRPLDLRVVSEKIKTLGLRPSNPQKLKEDILAFYKGPAMDLENYVLAAGTAPGKGKDRALSYTVSFLSDQAAEAIKARLKDSLPALGELKGLDEFPIAAAKKLAYVQEGKSIAALARAEPGAPGTDVFGKAVPGVPGNQPTVKAYDNVRYSQDAATPLLSGLLLVGEEGETVSLRALPYRDGECHVLVAPDLMSAHVSLFAGLGAGLALTEASVMESLKAMGVVAGIDAEALRAAVSEVNSGAVVQDRIVARGKPPKPAGSVSIEWEIKLASGKGVTLREDGTADYRNQDRVTTVAEGTLIARLVKRGDEGEPGQDLRGKAIPPERARADEKITHDDSVKEDASDPNSIRLIAARSGEIRFEKGALSVVQSRTVKGDVDLKTGNLKYPGDVQVTGDVVSGFMVVAGGNVTIGGGAEASLVSADGMVRMGLGMKGQQKGTIRARKGIELLFSEHAILMAVEDIKIKNACVSCTVKTNGKLSLLGDKGRLMGGIVRARKGVETQALGSESFLRTEVSFGQDYLLADQIEAEQRETERVKAALAENEKRMAQAERAGTDPSAFRAEKLKLLKLLEKRSMRLFTLNEQFEQHFPSEIRVRGPVYPGVVLESHNRFHEVRQQKSGVIFAFDQEVGRIVEKPLTGA
jgi:uncharacterized protein (DUF342 family)